MIHAFNMMNSKSRANNKRYINSRLYELARRNIHEVMSKLQSGNNSQYGKIWICYHGVNPIQIKAESFCEYQELGWVRGKKIKLIKIKNQPL